MTGTVALPTWFGRVSLVAFVAMQAFDGMLTYTGVLTFGPSVEGNPIVATYMALLGPGTALVVTKIFATGCAVLLYFNQRHREVAGLTILYAVAAVWPWMDLLDSTSLQVAASGLCWLNPSHSRPPLG